MLGGVKAGGLRGARIPLISPEPLLWGLNCPLGPHGLFFFPLFLLGSPLCGPLMPDWGGLGGRWRTDGGVVSTHATWRVTVTVTVAVSLGEGTGEGRDEEGALVVDVVKRQDLPKVSERLQQRDKKREQEG